MFEIPKFQISVFEFQISGQRQRRKNGAQAQEPQQEPEPTEHII